MKYKLLIMILLLRSSYSSAQQPSPLLECTFSAGYKVADIRWSIGANPSPNILSEVKWQSLTGPSTDAQVQLKLSGRWHIRATLSKCFIKAGKATDIDYAEDDRRSAVYQAILDSDEGHLAALGLYGGYHMLQREKVLLNVFAGYTIQTASLFLLDHASYQPGLKNLRSTYNTSWKGVSGGLSAHYCLNPRWRLTGTFEYSQLHYHAIADWNMVDAYQHPVSFKHQAKGFAMSTALYTTFQVSTHVSFLLSATYHVAETGTGTDKLFLESGTVHTSRFNGAYTAAKQVSAGTVIRF
jgi:hypothetical protein